MDYTNHYHLPQWQESDRIQMEDFNQMCADIEDGIAAAQYTGERGLTGLKKLAYDLCQLTYQQDGRGTYTGYRRGIALDGLGSDHQVEATTGAVVLEPDNGQIRLAVDGWSGGSIPWTAASVSVPATETGYLLTEEWSPAGNATLETVTFSGKISSGVTTSVIVTVILMLGDTELASSESATLPRNSGNTSTLTVSFPSGTLVKAENRYRLKFAIHNNYSNVDQVATLSGSSIPVTATAVRCTEGSFTTALLPLDGEEITAFVQASEGAAVTAELELPEGWAPMTQIMETASQSPEGDACRDLLYSLTLPRSLSGVGLRFKVESEAECMIYGYGVCAI